MGLWQWLLAISRRKSPQVAQTPMASAITVPHTDPVMAEFGSFLLDHAPLIRRALLLADREPIQPHDGELPHFSLRYRTLRRIGTGGMGEVYEAYDTACHRQVAIKVCRPGRSDEEARLNASLLASEPQRLGQLEHPNIVRVYEPGYLPDGRPWYAMELVEGIAVSDYAERQKLSPRQRVILISVVARAVGWMHGRGLMHLDLKPGNILVTSDGTLTRNDTLIIDHVSSIDHYGYYQCSASNRLFNRIYQDQTVFYLNIRKNSMSIPILIGCLAIGTCFLILILYSKYCRRTRDDR